VLADASVEAESVTYSILDRPPVRPGFLVLQFQDRLREEITLVEGRLPSGETEWVEAPDLPPAAIPIPEDREALLFEVALSTITARELDVGVGDRLDMIPDRDDPLVPGLSVPEGVAVRVTGLFEVRDPDADFWVGDRDIHEPRLTPLGLNTVLVHATALASPEAYPAMTRLSHPMRYAFRFTVDPDRLDAGRLDGLATSLRQMEAAYPAFASQPDPRRTTLRTALLDLTDRYLAERRSAEAVLMNAAMGPAAVALTAAAVVALLAVRRRRPALVLVRSRGGSALQLIGSHLAEGILLTAAPSAVAALLATALVESRATPFSWVAAGGVAVAVTLVLTAAATPTALRSLGGLAREAPASIAASPRRLAMEALAVALAIGGVVLLRQRGMAGGSAAGDLGAPDPLLAAVPALVGVAVGIVTLRLYPYPVRAAGWLAASGPGLVTGLGLRRAERQAGSGQLPLLVVLLTVAIGAFSSSMLATIERGQVAESWRSVGAAHRVASSAALPLGFDLSGVPGVEAVAGAFVGQAGIGRASASEVTLVAVDAAEYAAVTEGTPAETRWPGAFSASLTGERPGTTDRPIPAIVSRALARDSTADLGVGSRIEIELAARFATVEIVEHRDAALDLSAGSSFMIVPREPMQAAMRDRRLDTSVMYVRAPADAAGGIADVLAGTERTGLLVSQAAELDALRGRPLVRAVEAGFSLAVAVSLGYAALSVILSMLLSGSARGRETAQLRAVGIGPRQVTGLAVVEHGPPVVLAMAAGLGLGVIVAWVVLPGLGLGAFTGAGRDPELTIDLGQLILLAAALAVIVAIGVALAAWAQGRPEPAAVVREGAA
jgi:putative ABC transport system permease protein